MTKTSWSNHVQTVFIPCILHMTLWKNLYNLWCTNPVAINIKKVYKYKINIKKETERIRITWSGQGGGGEKKGLIFLDFSWAKVTDQRLHHVADRPWNRAFQIFQAKSTIYEHLCCDITCRCLLEWLTKHFVTADGHSFSTLSSLCERSSARRVVICRRVWYFWKKISLNVEESR